MKAFLTDKSLRFDYFLCRKLGWRSVDEMRAGMSVDEWNRWRVLYLLENQEQERNRG